MIPSLSYLCDDLAAPDFTVRNHRGKTVIGAVLAPDALRPWLFLAEDPTPVLQPESQENTFMVCLCRLGRVPRPLTLNKQFCSILADAAPKLSAYLKKLEVLLAIWASEHIARDLILIPSIRDEHIYFSYSQSSHYDLGDCRGQLTPDVLATCRCTPILLRLSWWANLRGKIIGLRLHLVRAAASTATFAPSDVAKRAHT